MVNKTSKVKDWYVKEYPTDELGERISDVTFKECYFGMKKGKDIYDLIGVGDSIVRERLFSELADQYAKGNYDTIYRLWLDN